MFGSQNAYWCNGKEIAHFDGPNVLDLRLTRSVIRELRPELHRDARVRLRTAGSDWIEVRVAASDDDVDFVLGLAERAAAAHRAPRGVPPEPPPRGADLNRRRRFH